jgi:hypothetical protein
MNMLGSTQQKPLSRQRQQEVDWTRYVLILFTISCVLTIHYFLAITMDNASSCDTLAQALGKLLHDKYRIHFHEDNNLIRCLAHVVNLVAQAILKALDDADSSDDIDYYLLHRDQPFHYNEDDDEDLREMEAEIVDVDELNADVDDFDSDLPDNVSSLSPVQRVSSSYSFISEKIYNQWPF